MYPNEPGRLFSNYIPLSLISAVICSQHMINDVIVMIARDLKKVTDCLGKRIFSQNDDIEFSICFLNSLTE